MSDSSIMITPVEEDLELQDNNELRSLLSTEVEEGESDRSLKSVIELRRGEDLEKSNAHFITARGQARVITLAGEVSSGKTTLLISLYEKFQQGPFGGYLFAGSETLMGFERRCWRSRITSGADSADTDRTPSGSIRILHLRVRPNIEKVGELSDLLMFDISGEDFREARNSTAVCLRMTELKRTDHFVLLIDGAKLVDPIQRHEAVYTSRQLLQRLLDSEMLNSQTLVNVLFSKYDLVYSHKKAEEVLAFIKETEEDFAAAFSERVAKLSFFKVAARPSGPGFDLADGLATVLPLWVEETAFKQLTELQLPARLKVNREFDFYYMRRLPHLFS